MVSESIVAMMVEYRKKQGWSQFAFADRLGVSERTIRRYEAGTAFPTIDVIESFAKLIGKTVTELIAEETDERKRKFLDDVWDVHMKHFSHLSSAGHTEEK